jgi:UDP-N-acetylmuramate dehydrogenase
MTTCRADMDTRALRGRLRRGEPLSRHTAWGIGGPAERLYEPADLDDLRCFLAGLPADEPLFWMGLGSNLLVRDGGIRGTVVLLANCLDAIERTGERQVRAEAGVPCPKVARFCARAGLGGSAFMAGIPGTVGGALAMNAGAFGGETYDIVHAVELVNRRGELILRAPGELKASYRHVDVPHNEWFVAAQLSLSASEPEETRSHIRALLKRRAETQPLGQRSCGSVFRNPPGDHAARLIEACGLKGRRIGDALVSPKHANFIINDGHASAADVEALIGLVMKTVRREHGITLVPEVRVVGELV